MCLVFLAFVAMFFSPLCILFVIVHHKTNVLVNLYWDSRYSDSDSVFEVSNLVFYAQSTITVISGRLSLKPVLE